MMVMVSYPVSCTYESLEEANDIVAYASGNDFGGGSNAALVGTLKTVPYSYTLIAASAVKAAVVGTAGATLSF